MTASKAIELLTDLAYRGLGPPNPDIKDAINLGTEALKRLESIRIHPGAPVYGPLPGESMPDRGIR